MPPRPGGFGGTGQMMMPPRTPQPPVQFGVQRQMTPQSASKRQATDPRAPPQKG